MPPAITGCLPVISNFLNASRYSSMSRIHGGSIVRVIKEVRFYDTVVDYAATDREPAHTKVTGANFWPKAFKKLEGMEQPKKRTSKVGQRQYYGAVIRPTSPPIAHAQVGRIRDLSEHIEETDLDTGQVTPLVLPGNRRVSEPTFVVPFFNSGRVAIMSPGRSTRPETVARWLNDVLGLVPKGRSIRFRAIVDEGALERLLNSKGAVGVEFALDAGRELPDGDDLPLLDAVEATRAEGPSVGTFYVGWSLGRGNGTAADKTLIKHLAERITSDRLARRATVNMVVEDEHGKIRHETHNMFEDQIVQKAIWQANPNQRSSSTEVLTAIAKAMQDFGTRGV
jgi:hypothetical protein